MFVTHEASYKKMDEIFIGQERVRWCHTTHRFFPWLQSTFFRVQQLPKLMRRFCKERLSQRWNGTWSKQIMNNCNSMSCFIGTDQTNGWRGADVIQGFFPHQGQQWKWMLIGVFLKASIFSRSTAQELTFSYTFSELGLRINTDMTFLQYVLAEWSRFSGMRS